MAWDIVERPGKPHRGYGEKIEVELFDEPGQKGLQAE